MPPVELTALRTQYSKTYDMGGGKRRLVVGGNISHYRDSALAPWEDVDLTVQDTPITSGFTHYFKKGQYRYEIDADRGIIKVYLKRGNNSRYVELWADPSGDQPVNVTVQNKFLVTVSWATPSVEHALYLSDNGVKIYYVLADDSAPDTYVLGYKFINTKKDGREVKDKNTDEVLGLLQDAWLQDSTGTRRDVQEVFDSDIVTLQADLSGLLFPVIMDPTLSNLSNTADAWLDQGAPSTNYGSSTQFNLGYTGGGVSRATDYLAWDISAIPPGSTIDSATPYLYCLFENIPDSGTDNLVGLYRCTRTDVVESQCTWNNYKSGSSWTSPGGDYTLTDRVLKYMVGTGWHLFGPSDASKNQFQYALDNAGGIASMILAPHSWSITGVAAFYSKEWGTPGQRPYANIEYTEGGAAAMPLMSTQGIHSKIFGRD
jgi:hypothetical protein